MKIYRNVKNFYAKNPVITTGTFDGVHRGHLHILNKLKEKARLLNGESVVVTFWPHPRLVLNTKGDEIKMLSTIDEKIELIRNQGIDHLVILEFTKSFSELSSCDFVKQYLCKMLNIKYLVIGYDHHFGKNREGGFIELSECARQHNFSIEQVGAFILNDEKISSTLIRHSLNTGAIEKANTFLSKKYSISGNIIGGKKIGRNIGFPTANIFVSESYKFIPTSGVYAVKAEIKGKKHPGMLNIGYKPTVSSDLRTLSIEVHILNFNDDIYNENVKLYFYKRIRDEIKFKNLEELKQRLEKDKAFVGKYFKLI